MKLQLIMSLLGKRVIYLSKQSLLKTITVLLLLELTNKFSGFIKTKQNERQRKRNQQVL